MSRKIILNLAISLDGYIADEYGYFDYLSLRDNSTNLFIEIIYDLRKVH